MECVTGHVSHICIYTKGEEEKKSDKVVDIVGGGSFVNRASPFSFYLDLSCIKHIQSINQGNCNLSVICFLFVCYLLETPFPAGLLVEERSANIGKKTIISLKVSTIFYI